ncbi:MAG: ABC transporter ATP-binding protein [Thermoplasmatales archaeon]|jgi:ABC-2 type transport system ATP-binding protein|nr:ABC transporter ATP-binding protein [Candidatus Thermoplasmatota archaeon]MCL6003524.1 ABC transporter ATP-binding protein [Candidatus Thermoplasmatota archaeon]MDA8055987.1 ABC transporter ATP-binding protein [Thermoplasmatales archaeon]
MITIDNLTKIYSAKEGAVVDSLSFEIKDGEIFGFVGLNGAGKSTTIRISAGVTLPSRGDVRIDGKSIIDEKVGASREIGWVPELPNFEMNVKPIPLMRYFAGYYGLKGDQEEEHINQLLKEVGLWEHRNKKLRGYSQGMKKRFSLAESLLGDPNNLMFDETLNGLDPEGVQFVRNLIMDQKKKGKAILLSSHILSEIEAVSDRIGIIHHGKLMKVLDKGELNELGREKISMEIDNFDDQAQKVLSKYGEVKVSNGEVRLTTLKIEKKNYPNIVNELVQGGYRVRSFEPSGESLEEYFFNTIGDAA